MLTDVRGVFQSPLPRSAPGARASTAWEAYREGVCEREGDFGEWFVELARAVYKKNDARAALKRQIDQLLGAPFSEQKDDPV
jgi:hypothetical protein